MELRTYLAILARRNAVIVVTTLVTVVVGLTVTALLPSTYEASATLRIATVDESADQATYDSVMYATRLANTYSKLAASGSVLDELASRVGLAERPKVKVDVPANTELMQLTVEHRDPFVAADAANALADILSSRARQYSADSARSAREALAERLGQAAAELEQARSATSADGTVSGRALDLQRERYARLQDQYDRLRSVETSRANAVALIEPASPPREASRPRKTLNVAVALALGLVGGTGLAFLFENLDTKLYTTRRIGEVAALPILGAIPTGSKQASNGVFRPDSPGREALRHLRTHLVALEGARSRTLLVTSAEPVEGKSTVVANLAASLAEAGRRVVVVDADLRRPTLHTLLAVPNQRGLSTILMQEATWDEVVRDTRLANVWAITSGQPTPSTAELLRSPRLVELIEHLARWFDAVLLDAPSLLGVADAGELARSVDGVLLVVGRGRAREEAVQAATAELAAVRARTLGVVVNHAEPVRGYRYYQSAASERAPTDRAGAEQSPATRLEAHGRHHGDSRGQHAVP